MKILNRYILKEHLFPFFMALFILLFVLLTNFLLRSFDRFLGKGLPFSLILEYIFLNLAWILALAVPMAILVSTLMAFGRLSADNEISAMRSVSVSYLQLLMPVIYFGSVVAVFMMYFNNQILPEMNHKARKLSSDISRKRPDLDFDVGYFIDAIPQYTFLLGSRNNEIFQDITIFTNGEGAKNKTITAKSGTIITVDQGVVLNLVDGTIHEYIGNEQNAYRQIFFSKYSVMIPVDNMSLRRRDSSIRGDREMTFSMMRDKIFSYKQKIINVKKRISERLINESNKLKIVSDIDSTSMITIALAKEQLLLFEQNVEDSLNVAQPVDARVKRRIKNIKRGIESDFSLITSYRNSISKYKVELHKKFSIPFASLVFILIGAPLGMMSRKSGFSVSMAFSLGFFVIYWIFLIGGEEFADRGYLSPVLSMWLPNLVLGILGLFMCYFQSLEQRILNLEFINIFKRNNKKASI